VIPFPFRKRFRLAWELTWPFALIDLSVVLLLHGVLAVSGETGDAIWAVASFFLVSPWVIRRALRREYGGSRIVVLRGGAVSFGLGYQESLKVMWLLAWRSLVLALAALLAISLALRVTGLNSYRFSTQDPVTNSLGLSLVEDGADLVLFPFLIPGMLRKRYRGFRLELQAPEPKPLRPRKR
jgi:hypothetical protein